MTGMQIVREETARMLRGFAPLTLIAFGAFVIAGCDPLRAGISLLLGAGYALLLFRMLAVSAARAALFPPAQAVRRVRAGYLFRYVLTGIMVFAAIKVPFIHPLAAVLPLFFPKMILLWCNIVQRKGG